MDVAMRATYRGQVTKVANSASEYLKLPETQIKECNADKFYEIEEELTVYLERLTEVQSRSLNVSSSDPHRSICNHNSAAKLPKLSLRTFSGDFKEWLPFWEAFRTAVHDQDNLTGADKFNYLQLHLTGKAADSISGFIPSDENYHAAISLLQEEYGDTEKLIDHTIQQLMSLSQVSSRRDALGLRRLYNSVTTSTRSLTVLGVPSTQYSVMLKSLLLRCIPDELVVDFYRTHQGTSSDDNVENVAADITSLAGSETSSIGYNGDKQVRDILKYLKGEVESLERSIQTQTNRPLVQRSQREYKTAAGLLTSNEVLKCCFCNSDSHTSQHCNTPLTIAQRKEILKREGRCFRCTRKGHNSRACMSKSIKCDHCGGRHSLSMCDPSYHSSLTEPPSSRSTNTKSINTAEVLPTTSLCSATSESSDVYLQTACVLASHSTALNSQSTSIRIILDGGSQRTYITQHVASRLGLQIFDKVKLRILPFGSVEKSPVKLFNRVQVVLKGRHNKQPVSLLAVVVPSICVDILPVPSAKCPMFTKFELADDEIYSESGLCMLIGADYYWNIVYNESKRITSNLVAINSVFGWTIQYPVVNSVNKESLILSAATTTLNVCTVDDTDLKRFWDLESVGIMNNNINNEAWDFNNYVVKNGERYEASLLWRQDNILLDDNRNCAVFRCKKLIQKLARDESKLMEYDAAMQEMIEFGVAERVNGDCVAERIFYMPHRPVYREDKATTKLRIVFDASAHSGTNLSLNQNLSAGPNLLPDLLTVLLNFRIGAIGLVADIEKAFLQISLAARDRDAHRFLWFEDKVTCKGQLPPLAIYRMTRVTFGVACSPFLLCATLKKHFTQESQVFPETCDLLQNSFYMDDFVTSIDDMKTAINVHKESCEILGRASMRIRKWNSNCQQMRTSFNEKPPKIQKVLGLIWSCYNDELAIDLRQLCDVKILAPTKRNVLEVIAKIFDPLGLFGPFVVKLKILFQELWKLKLDWDESIPHRLQTTWNAFLPQISLLNEITLPRCVYISSSRIRQELHVFADASLRAYGTVAYIRSIGEDESIHVMYLCSKNRVAPLRKENSAELTLPKLELTAALIAARLTKYLIENLTTKFDATYLWSDSTIALHWIHNDNQKYKPYVAHRVQEIRHLTKTANWRHCPGNENPADVLTRGLSGKQLLSAATWINGPSWLSSKSDNWPEINSIFINSTLLLYSQIMAESDEGNTNEPMFTIENFSCYRKAIRVTAYVLRFINRLRHNQQVTKFLNGEEIQRAESYWIKYTQYQIFSKEVSALKGGNLLPKSSPILTLNPMLDEEEVLRLQTRLQQSNYGFNEIYPILLPKSTYFTELLVQDAHERTLHGGVNVVLTRLREKFWIIKSRQLVKNIVKRCKVCHRLKGLPASQPIAPLPKQRLHTAKPFETTGVDFAGPLYVRNPNNEKSTNKVYVMVLTCAVVRAVHLELVPSLTCDSCLLALRRFFARRGVPKCILSDNARTFKRASLELRHLGPIIDSENFQGFISNEGISWNFIVERAAWWGGFWERLVKIVKDILKITISRAVLTTEQLQTFLVEAESTINSRPLTYISDDPVDLSPLTPNHFLKGSCSTIISSPGQPSDNDIRLKWKARVRLSNLFMKRFKTEYIQQLRSAHHSKQQFSTKIETGDVVIMYDESTPRLFWKLAVVANVFPGRDGKIRACELRFSDGSILRRPIQHIYPLELKSQLNRPAGGC